MGGGSRDIVNAKTDKQPSKAQLREANRQLSRRVAAAKAAKAKGKSK